MNTTLWIAQILLSVMFTMAGIMKSTLPIEKLLSSGLDWVNRFPSSIIKIIGISELLGAIGLILPWILGIDSIVTSFAACGLALMMVLAAFHHFKRKEYKAIVFNSVLLILSLFVAIGRF